MPKPTDHDLIIRIDERLTAMMAVQAEMQEIQKQTLYQVKETNGRVSALENYRENNEKDVAMIHSHEDRLDGIDKRHSELSGAWRTVVLIGSVVGGVAGIGGAIYEIIKHS